MKNNKNKKKRKFKKGFKLFLWLIFFIIIFILFFLFKDKIISNISKYNINLSKIENKTKKEEINTTNISTDEFSNLFRMQLPSQNLEYLSSGPIEENGDMKIFLKNTNNGYLYINTKDDPKYVWITFVSALAGEPLKASITNDLNKLSYVDLRFGNKVFYKFSNESVSISENTSHNEDLNKSYLNSTNSSITSSTTNR